MNSSHEVRCYALRRLNPFLGVLQVVETGVARASSSNGLVWEIQLLSEAPAAWGSLGRDSSGKAWQRYGLWSEREGLSRPRLVSRDTDPHLQAASEHLTEQIRLNMDRLPFALADHRELWLLDAERQEPLALLHALSPAGKPPRPEPRHWTACPGSRDIEGQRAFAEAAELEAQVRARAGFNARRVWVTRDPEDWSVAATSGAAHRYAFPAFGIREDWPDQADCARVQRYIEWAAASLLTLPCLDDAERSRLESRLTDRASSVEHHWRLYPKIIDRSRLVAARVQAALENSATRPRENPGNAPESGTGATARENFR